MIPDADSYSDLPGVLPQWAGGALDWCAEIGIYKAHGGVRGQGHQHSAMHAASDMEGGQHGFRAGLGFKREREESRLVTIEMAQAAFEGLGVSEEFYVIQRPAVGNRLLEILLRDFLKEPIQGLHTGPAAVEQNLHRTQDLLVPAACLFSGVDQLALESMLGAATHSDEILIVHFDGMIQYRFQCIEEKTHEQSMTPFVRIFTQMPRVVVPHRPGELPDQRRMATP